jgi:hypothetical protein
VIVGFAVALLLAPLGSLLAQSPTLASQTPNSFHWGRKPAEFTIQAGNNVSGGWTSLLRQAISDWNKGDAVTIKETGGSGSAQECRASKGRIEVCNWNYGTQEGWLGLTRLFFNAGGDHVESATVQMNDSFFDQNNGQYNSNSARRHTICHEVGHTIGLDHVNNGSCMNDSQQAVFNNVVPKKQDFAQLARIYQHKDSTTTVSGAQKKQKNKKKKKNKNKKKNQDAKKEQKRKIRERKRARKERAESQGFFAPTSLPSVPSGLQGDETVTVETLDDGRTVVTFIIWAN